MDRPFSVFTSCPRCKHPQYAYFRRRYWHTYEVRHTTWDGYPGWTERFSELVFPRQCWECWHAWDELVERRRGMPPATD